MDRGMTGVSTTGAIATVQTDGTLALLFGDSKLPLNILRRPPAKMSKASTGMP
jgi:hypothetical protein